MGVARCNTLSELCETLKLFHKFRALKGDKISLMGPSGGDMAMIGDMSDKLSINYSPIPKDIVKKLKKINHKGVIISNPFDLQTYNWNDPVSIKKTFDLMFKANFNLVGLMLDFPNIEECDIIEWNNIVDKFLLSSKGKNKQGIIFSSLPDTFPKEIREKCLKAGVVPLQGLNETLFAIHSSILIGKAWSKYNKIKIFKPADKNYNLPKTYSEYDSKKILNKYGISIPKSIISPASKVLRNYKKINYPLVLKINSKNILHKTEINGVFTNINSKIELRRSLKHLSKIGEEILIEKMIKDKVIEMIVGIKIDDQFGPVIIIGAGGEYTELFQDSVTLLMPLTKSIILKAINNLKICKLLKGYRGKPKGDINALTNTIMKLAKFAEKNASKLIEVDINPLIIRPKNKGVIAADALIHYLDEIN